MSNWKTIEPGLMLWAPPETHDSDNTLSSFSNLSVSPLGVGDYQNGNDDCGQADSVLPTVGDDLRVKQDIFQELCGSTSLAVADQDSTTSSDNACTPATVNGDTFLEQLQSFASSAYSGSSTGNTSYTNQETSIPPSSSSNSDYDSDHTDFRSTSRTPCPSRSALPPQRQIKSGTRSLSRSSPQVRHIGHARNSSKLPVQRTLDFGAKVRTADPMTKRKRTEAPIMEYSPSHPWTDEEREFLCVLYRWYERAPRDFSRIYNATFGQDLPMTKIRDQFERHLRFYGPEAYPVLKAVFAVPFNDPAGEYASIRAMIEMNATALGIELDRLTEEVFSPSGTAQRAKARSIRKEYKRLVQRAKQQEQARSVRSPIVYDDIHRQLLGGQTLHRDSEFDMSEHFSDIEDTPGQPIRPNVASLRSVDSNAKLGFRVWSPKTSRTLFTEKDGFTSEIFSSLWRGPLPPPFSFDGQGKQAINLLLNMHFCMSGGASAWISVSTSLLQALVKACSMDRPRLAVIALDHPSLKGPKTLQAADQLRELKKEGLAWWARYRGYAERIIWANIPRQAVIHHFSLGDLISLADTYHAVAELLYLQEFKPGLRTKNIGQKLRSHNTVLDNVTANSMAMVCREFGLNNDNVGLPHIQEFVGRLVDGWYIGHSATNDSITDDQIAITFAIMLGSRAHRVQDVAEAFMNGIKEGSATIAFYARKRRPATRRVSKL